MPVSMGNWSSTRRKRDVPVVFRVSAVAVDAIRQTMVQFGTKNRSAYLREEALGGYKVQLDLPELKELVSLMRYSSNKLNQLPCKVHESGRVYDAELEGISQRQEQRWEGLSVYTIKQELYGWIDYRPNTFWPYSTNL